MAASHNSVLGIAHFALNNIRHSLPSADHLMKRRKKKVKRESHLRAYEVSLESQPAFDSIEYYNPETSPRDNAFHLIIFGPRKSLGH